MILVCLLSGCSDDTTNSDAANEIRFNVDVWQVMPGTRATTFEGANPLASGSFTASAYEAGSTTPYITPTTVEWITDHWEFSDGKHYWPASGSLDFFAYMPATKPDYISSITYEVNSDPAPRPSFVCADLPMTYQNAYTDDTSVVHSEEGQGSDLAEFVWALTTGQNKTTPGASGVTMNFCHPFARINFQLSASHPDITINSITFKALKSGGTCSFDGSTSTWSSLTPADKTVDFKMTLKGDGAVFNDNNASVPLTQVGPTILMVPQTFAGDIEVNASWTDWGVSLAHTVSTTLSSLEWRAGYSYTYTFTISETDLKVDTSKFTEQW